MAVAEQAELVVQLKLNDKISSGISSVQRRIDVLDASTRKLREHAKTTGQNLKTIFTVVAAAGAGAVATAVRSFADYEDQLAIINTVANLSAQELTDLGVSLRKTAMDSGVFLEDLTSGYYDLVSAGIAAKDAQTVLNAAVKLGIGGLASTGESINLLTTALNAYGLKTKDVERVTNGFAQSIAAGATTASEIAASFGRVAPTAAAAGIEIEELQATIAQMTVKGIPAAEVATAVRNAITALQRPTKELDKAQAKLGINFKNLARNKGLAVAYQELSKYAKENGVEMIDLVGRVEAVQFALSTTGPEFKSYNDNLRAVRRSSRDGGVAARQMAQRQDTLARTFGRLRETVRDVVLIFGEKLAPSINRIGRRITAFIQDNRPKIQELADTVGKFVDSLTTNEQIDQKLKDALEFLGNLPWGTIVGGLSAAAAASRAAISAFSNLPQDVQTGLIALLAANKLTGGLVSSGIGALGGLILRNLTTINASVVNVIGAKVNDGTGVDVPAGGGGGGGLSGGFGMFLRQLPIIGMALEAQDRARVVIAKSLERQRINREMFRSGIITGLPGMTPGLKPELSPRQQLANQFAGTQALIRAIMASGGQASPGTGGAGRVQNDVILKLGRLAELSEEGGEKAADISMRLGLGLITERQANRTLDALLVEQQNVKRLIAGQKTTVNVTNQTTISAVAAQRSLTIVANSHRAIIE